MKKVFLISIIILGILIIPFLAGTFFIYLLDGCQYKQNLLNRPPLIVLNWVLGALGGAGITLIVFFAIYIYHEIFGYD